jgi:hypothetical protein
MNTFGSAYCGRAEFQPVDDCFTNVDGQRKTIGPGTVPLTTNSPLRQSISSSSRFATSLARSPRRTSTAKMAKFLAPRAVL